MSGTQADLPNFLEKMRSRHFVQLCFINYFNGHLFAREHMPRQFDDCEVTRAKRLLQVVETGNFAVVDANAMAAMIVAVVRMVIAGATKRVHISSLEMREMWLG